MNQNDSLFVTKHIKKLRMSTTIIQNYYIQLLGIKTFYSVKPALQITFRYPWKVKIEFNSPGVGVPFFCGLEEPRGAGGGGGESLEDPPLLVDCSVNTVRPDLRKKWRFCHKLNWKPDCPCLILNDHWIETHPNKSTLELVDSYPNFFALLFTYSLFGNPKGERTRASSQGMFFVIIHLKNHI